MVFCILQFPSWPCVSVSSFIKLSSILLEIYSEHKYDGRTVALCIPRLVSVEFHIMSVYSVIVGLNLLCGVKKIGIVGLKR